MTILLQILGALLLGAVLLILGFYLYIRIKMGKYADMDLEKDLTPLIIHLNEECLPDWVETPKAVAIADELKNLGFIEGKSYIVVEMDGFELKSYHKAPFTAVMYSHPIAGNWIDIMANTKDDYEYTVTNAPMGSEMDIPPNTEKYFLVDDTPSQLFAKIKELVGDKECQEIDIDNFRESFESAYKKEMQWKNKNGGISFEEFIKIAENDPQNYSDDIIDEAFVDAKRKELHKWHNGALEVYREAEGISSEDFYDISYTLLIVPIKTDSTAFIHYLSDIGFITEEKRDKLEKIYEDEESIVELFDKINDSFSPQLRAVEKGKTDYPIDIVIYKMHQDFL
ncbi:MAG: hypothetical protein U9R27_03560 [Campylobacterota bacterium]|nr:hypothetical protein [Campylobacterota bacterium]